MCAYGGVKNLNFRAANSAIKMQKKKETLSKNSKISNIGSPFGPSMNDDKHLGEKGDLSKGDNTP